MDKYDLTCLAVKIKSIIFKDGLSLQMCKLGFSLLSKIIELNKFVAFELLEVDNLIFLIEKLQVGAHQNTRFTSTVFAILDTFSSSELF